MLVALVLVQCVSVLPASGFFDGPVRDSSEVVVPVADRRPTRPGAPPASAAPVVRRGLPISPFVDEERPRSDAPQTTGRPVRLTIQSIHVDAPIDAVRLTPDGSLDTPASPDDAGWYMLGPKPGETGNAVIDGHLNWWHGATGVFAHLRSVKPGDRIVVQDDAGTGVSFVVRGSRTLGAAEDASHVFLSSDGASHLNLITCAGAWDPVAKRYSRRLVVFADKVPDQESADDAKDPPAVPLAVAGAVSTDAAVGR